MTHSVAGGKAGTPDKNDNEYANFIINRDNRGFLEMHSAFMDRPPLLAYGARCNRRGHKMDYEINEMASELEAVNPDVMDDQELQGIVGNEIETP